MPSLGGGSLLLARWVVAMPGRWWASGAGRGGRQKWPWSDGVGWVVADDCGILKKEAGSVIEMMMSVRVSPTPYLYGSSSMTSRYSLELAGARERKIQK